MIWYIIFIQNVLNFGNEILDWYRIRLVCAIYKVFVGKTGWNGFTLNIISSNLNVEQIC